MPQPPAPRDRVVHHLDTDHPDPVVGTVIDHAAADMTPPDYDVVLVRWTRTSLRWEYTDDLAVIERAAVPA